MIFVGIVILAIVIVVCPLVGMELSWRSDQRFKLDLERLKLEVERFQESTRPPVAVRYKQRLTTEQVCNLRKSWEAAFTGSGTPTKLIVLPPECEAEFYQRIDGVWTQVKPVAEAWEVNEENVAALLRDEA